MAILDAFRQSKDSEAARVAEVIHGYSLFSDLGSSKLAKLVPILRAKRFTDEEIVCHCPDATHDAFVILEGKVALTVAQGDDLHVVDLEGAGGVFNTAALVDAPSGHIGARALGTVSVLSIDTTGLKDVFARDPEIGFPIVRNLCRLTLLQADRLVRRIVA